VSFVCHHYDARRPPPTLPTTGFPELAVQARVFLSLALAPQAPTDVILAALADCTIEALCNRDTSLEIVEAVLRIVEERNGETAAASTVLPGSH
jgi:hypothetical protein